MGRPVEWSAAAIIRGLVDGDPAGGHIRGRKGAPLSAAPTGIIGGVLMLKPIVGILHLRPECLV